MSSPHFVFLCSSCGCQLIAIATDKAESLAATQATMTSIAENYDNISASFTSLQSVWAGIANKVTLPAAQTDGLTLLGENLLGADSLAAIDAMEIKNKEVHNLCVFACCSLLL